MYRRAAGYAQVRVGSANSSWTTAGTCRTENCFVGVPGHARAQGTSSPLALLRCHCLAQETKSNRAVALAPPLAGKSGTFPDRRIFARGNSPTPCGPSRSRVYRARSHRRRAGIRFALLTDSNNHAGAKVTATATYCGHTLQAETDIDDLGRWTGRCVVDGPQFQGTVVLYSPFRAPTAALDALLTAAQGTERPSRRLNLPVRRLY